MHSRGFGAQGAFDALLLVLGGVIGYVSWGYGFGSLEQPGPGLYPFFIAAVIVACAAALIIARLRAPDGEPPPEPGNARMLTVMTITFCLWVLAMPLAGYVLATFAATYAFCKALALEGWRKPLALSGGTAAFIYLLFGHGLYIDLPRGFLFE